MQKYTVKNTERITPTTLLLTLQAKRNRGGLDFYPGQYAAIGYKRSGRPSPMRCFSIVSSPNNPGELQFATRVYGDFTQALSRLEPGDQVFVHGPFGDFVIDERYDKNVVLMAGGIGVTPFMSMIRYAAEVQLPIPITLLFSCRSQDDIPFYKELLELERRNPRFKIVFFVTQGGVETLSAGRIVRGRIDKWHLGQVTKNEYNQFTFFICGPKSFTKGLEDTLLAQDTDPQRIITEEFTPSSQVKSISATPRFSIARWTYGLTGASLLLGTAFIMTLDLARAVPRLVSAQASQTPATSQTQSTPASSSTVGSSSSGVSTPAASSSTANTSTAPTNSSTQSTPTYQQPVTSVS